MNDNFHLKIVSKDGILYEDDIKSLTSFNQKGKFDILSFHANFISIIYKKIIIIDKNNIKKELDIEKALLRNKENNLEIYSGIDDITSR